MTTTVGYEYLTIERKGYIATITLNRPDRMNALNKELTREFHEVLDEVDLEFPDIRVVIITGAGRGFCAGADVLGQAQTLQQNEENPASPLHKFSDKEWKELAVESLNWSLSQFMHGEQGALLCTAKIVETVPWIDAKYYASTQVVDEARHVEVFAQYLDQKMGGINYPVNHHLKALLDDIIEDSRWDITYLGMQIWWKGWL